MGSKVHCRTHPCLTEAPQIRIEESIEMSGRQQEGRWIVRQKFEPDRLSQVVVEQAYAKVVPLYLQVVYVSIHESKVYEMCEQPQEKMAR
jgi:hypothetical protein